MKRTRFLRELYHFDVQQVYFAPSQAQHPTTHARSVYVGPVYRRNDFETYLPNLYLQFKRRPIELPAIHPSGLLIIKYDCTQHIYYTVIGRNVLVNYHHPFKNVIEINNLYLISTRSSVF